MAAIAEIVQGGVQGGSDIGFGIYDRYKQEQREKERQKQLDRMKRQTGSDYDKMLEMLEEWGGKQTELSTPSARAKYASILSDYDPEDYVYDFDRFQFTDADGKPLTREDFIAANREEILKDVSDRLQHTAAGAGLGRGSGAAASIAEGVESKDEELLKLAQEQYNTERGQAYSEWSDFIDKMQANLDRKSGNLMNYANLAGGAIQADKQQQSDYMADLLNLLQNKTASVNQANLALLT